MANLITVPALKVTIPLKPDQIPSDLVPAEPLPTGNPVLTVQLAGTGIVVAVHLSGKNARKTMKLLAQHGPGNINLVVNGNLRPGPQAETWMVAEASFQTFIKPQPSDATPNTPGAASASGTGASNLTQPPK